MGVQAGASAAVAESALASMYKLRSHGHKHKRELPRFAEKEQGVFSDGLKGAAGKVAAVAKGVAAKVAAVAAPSAAPGGPVGMGMAPINAPVDFPPAGNIGKAPNMGEHLFVPFGKAIPRKAGTTYFTASSRQECMICKYIQGNQNYVGTAFYELCNGMWPEYMAMCHAQQKTLQGCPEFTQGWCYQDLGGSQVLRSPCPMHLVCHYCLGLNPLFCINGGWSADNA